MEKPAAKRRNMNGSMISELLPEPILHQILSLLSQKDAVRTCVLSKSWRHLWCARSKISFHRSDFVICRSGCRKTRFCRCLDENNKTLRSSLEKTLQRYFYHKLSIENIELEIFKVDSQWISLLEKWIPFLIVPDMLLKTFSLCFAWSLEYFDLPCVVFQVKSLEKLCLKFCRVNQFTGTVRLSCLQTLSLNNVFIDVETLEMLMSSCPLIENAVVEECDGLRGPKVIRVKHNNLKHFTFSAYVEICFEEDDSPGIEIDAPNLISLSLKEVQLHPNYFNNLSSNFPRLEDLSLLCFKGLGELKLSSRSIKKLAIEADKNSIEATIDAPNLHDFKFKGEFPQTSLTFAKTSSEWKSRVRMTLIENHYEEDELPWFLNLGDLLRALSKSQISLDVSYDKLQPNQQIEEGEAGFNHEPVVVENMRFGIDQGYAYSSPSLPHFLNGLFSVCRPRYTQTLYNYNSKELFKFLCKVLMLEREKRDYFWQKDLEEVGMEVLDKETNVWNPTSLPDCELPDCEQNIRFRLNWSG